MVLEAFGEALQYFTIPGTWVVVVLGVVTGLVFGLIPGIGGMLAIVLALPFILALALKPEQALPLLLSISAVQFTAGSILAILIAVPGTPVNAATLIDGFPLTQKGEGGRALGAALVSSGAGGIVSVILALAMVPLVLPMVMAITSADMVFIILLGITFIATLSRGSMIKGLISGGLGLMISFIGLQIGTGIARFTLGTISLYDGIHLIPLALAIFALPEMIDLANKGGTIAETGAAIKGMRNVFEGIKDVFRHWTVFLRGTLIGYVIGIIPGVGAETAIFVAYGQAKETSKHPEKFGTGCIEGVIAPESANNAKEGGALLTTLALGVPGGAIMAILLGALLMVGLTPGPEMLTIHLDLSLFLILVIAIANILAVLICLPVAGRMAKVANIPAAILIPPIVVMVFLSAFTQTQFLSDLVVLLVFTAVGLAMKEFGFNRPALFLGYILGRLFEKYFFIALATAGPLFFLRPISLVLIFVIIFFLCFRPIKGMFARRYKRS